MPRQVINITTLHDGLNLRDNPNSPSLPEGMTEVCVGVDLTLAGVVKTATGYTTHDLGSKVPSGVSIHWIESVWMNGIEYVLCTTSSGFYANGTLIGASDIPTYRFKAIGLGSNIYILCSTTAYRFDGTSMYRWGIAAPDTSDAPTITAGDVAEKVIDNFDGALTDFIANASNCVISSEATIVKEGTKSMKMTVAAEVVASTWDTWATDKDFEVFDDSSTSQVGDIIRLPFYATNLGLISSIKVVFDVGDGSFNIDSYSYTFQFQREVQETTQVVERSSGIASEVAPVTTDINKNVWIRDTTTGQMMRQDQAPWQWPYGEGYEVFRFDPADLSQPYSAAYKDITHGDDGLSMPEGVGSGYTQDSVTIKKVTAPVQTGFQSNAWCDIEIPKQNFLRSGTTGDWSTVCGVKIIVTTLGAVNIYFDELLMVGGGQLTGEYYFMYGWGRSDADGNVIHYSGPARNSDKALYIQGPITFNRQKVEWSARVASTDPQVNCCILYISGGTIPGWMVGHVISDNDTSTGEYAISEDDLYKAMPSLRNEPAPGGNNMLWWGGRFWIVGPSDNRSGIRCSAISSDGDLMVEAFPGRNTLILGEGGGELYSAHELNGQIVILGKLGEYSFVLQDPADLSSVHESRPSMKQIDGRDAYILIDDTIIYPAIDSFMQSNGMSAKAILPTISSIVPQSNMSYALGVYRSFDGFFTFFMPEWGNVIARLDFFAGQARISIHGQHEIDCLLYRDKKTYAIIDSSLYLFDSGYSANGGEMWMQIRSKAFDIDKEAVWQYIAFSHNTGGNYFRVRIFIDGVDRGFQSFMSTTRTEEYFMFGPVKGNSLQVQFEGDYRDLGEDDRTFGQIFLPVRLYVDG